MAAARYRFDRFELQPAERRLLVDGAPAALGARAYDLLMALVERRGRTVAKDELLAAIWPGVVVEEANLAVQVSALRRVLGNGAIATVAGRGYQFTAELEPVAESAATPAANTSTVPVPATRLIGRDTELRNLDALLNNHRLVTVAGPGGIGKTRLVLGWCETAGGGLPIAWVELAAVADAATLPSVLLAAVGAAAGGQPAVDALRAALASRELLLVLDNAEPVAAALAALVRTLLEVAPRLRVLVTSQVPLRLPDEQVYRLGALALPEGRATPEQAMAHGAVALFVERARAADPQFELSPGNVTSVIEICSRLDGVPLALELAAARVATLGVTALAAALDARLRVVGDTQRVGAPARQRTLRAALEWSHGLLDARAKAVFRRLGVFSGRFTLGAAQAVAGSNDADDALDGWTVMVTLGRLVEDSLVVRGAGDVPRYELLETARLYSLERLERSGEAPAVRARHLAWCTAFVRDALAGGPDALARIDAEYPNLRAALEHALAREDGDRRAGAALAVALEPYWRVRDAGDERQHWLEPRAATPVADAADTTAERLLERLQADGLAAAPGGLDAQTVIALARRLSPAEVRGTESALKELARAVQIAQRVLDGGADGEGATDAFVADALDGVAGHTRAGDFDRAADQLDDALAELDRRDAQRRATLQRSRRALLEAGVQQDLLRRDAFAVARRIEAIAALDDPERPTATKMFREREAQALAEGRDQGSGLSLAVGIELLRRRLAAADTEPLRRDLQRQLADALRLQGLRDGRGAALVESEQLVRAALASAGDDAAPEERAALHHVLAAVLRNTAAAERNAARSRALFDEAVASCRVALALRPRELDAQGWAETQYQLGTLLRMRAAGGAGRDDLLAAVDALQASLLERTRARMPIKWGRTHAALGMVLSMLARLDNSTAHRLESIQAFRVALLELTRERAPNEWASVQNGLGIELAEMGQQDGRIDTLQAAVDAYRDALREFDRERTPGQWAAAQHNLGGALRLLGERETGTQSLREAVIAFREAMSIHTREASPLYWAAGQNDLALVLLALGRRESDTASFEQAVQALREALLERRRERMPVDWATTQLELAEALLALGDRTFNPELVGEARAALEAALEVLTGDVMPHEQARARQLLAKARCTAVPDPR